MGPSIVPNQGMDRFFDSLQEKHIVDLEVYRASHQNGANRILHWILIPVETAGFFTLAESMLSRYYHPSETILRSARWSLGLLSFRLAQDDGGIGIAVLLFHLFMPRVRVPWLVVSWVVQICVGHWIFEQNQPTLQQGTASSLSMLTSVLIAWKS